MEDLLVLLDSTPAAWQAAYTAFDVAARLGTGLVGAVPMERLAASGARTLLRSFESGARAAGVRVSSRLLSSLSILDVLEAGPLEGVFISQHMAADPATRPAFLQLLADLPHPVWIVPAQRAIRRSLVVSNDRLSNAGALQYARSLARRWDMDLQQLPIDSLQDASAPRSSANGAFSAVDLDRLLLAIAAKGADLVFLEKPGGAVPVFEVCLRCNCLLVVCPPRDLLTGPHSSGPA